MVVTFDNSFWPTNIHGAEIETGNLTSFVTFFSGIRKSRHIRKCGGERQVYVGFNFGGGGYELK